jgi:hypothetical protein
MTIDWQEVRGWMWDHVAEHVDVLTGEVVLTTLVGDAMEHFHDWLGGRDLLDEFSEVALEVSEARAEQMDAEGAEDDDDADMTIDWREVRRWMWDHVTEHVDFLRGEVVLTTLVEDAMRHFYDALGGRDLLNEFADVAFEVSEARAEQMDAEDDDDDN